MVFINMTESIGIILGSATSTTFGSMFMALFAVMIGLFAIAMLFGIPLELTAILLFPYILVCGTYYNEFMGVLVFAIFYFTFLFVKRFIFR
jgi:hypothetical protein